MVEAFQWYSVLSISSSAAAVAVAVLVLRRTPNRPAGNTLVTAMVFFFLASIFSYLLRASNTYYVADEETALFFARLFYFFHMLAVGYTASFVGSYFYGFQILSRRYVNLGMQISLLIIAIYVSALVTRVEDVGTYGVQVRSYGATRMLAYLATAYMAIALAAIVRTLWKNRDPTVRRQAGVMLGGIVAHGVVAELYWFYRMSGAGYPPPVLTATALIMAGTFAFAILRYQMFVVTPKGEASTTLPRKFPLKDGHAYLVRERKVNLAFRALSEAAHRGRKALVVSRLPPSTVREEFDLEATPVLWLTEATGQNHVPPTHLDTIEELVGRFVAATDAPVVGIEGIEYLTNFSDFDRVLRTVRRVRDLVTAKQGVFLLSVNASALDERELSLVDKEFDPLTIPASVEAVEDVFLIHQSGLLISHAARRLKPEKDRDTMAGMLTAIMNFARVSFAEGTGELRRLELGEKTVALERGRYLILAVVFAGDTTDDVDSELRAFLWRAERRFGVLLDHWSGRMEEVTDLHAMTQRMVDRLLTV